MTFLSTVYTALAIFGIGITAIDFLGVFNQEGDSDSASEDGSDADAGDVIDSGAGSNINQSGDDADDEEGSNLNPQRKLSKKSGFQIVTRILRTIRTAVYFALGSGPTGLFALYSGLNAGTSLIWSGAAGIASVFIVRMISKLLRKEMDSSIHSSELILGKAVLLTPILPGEMGKAAVQQYGRELYVYVKCKDSSLSLPKGAITSIVEFSDNIYLIEPF